MGAANNVPELGLQQYQLLYQVLLGDIDMVLRKAEDLQQNMPNQEAMLLMLGKMGRLTDMSAGQIEQFTRVSLELTQALETFERQNHDFISIHKSTLDAMNSELRAIGQHEQKMIISELQTQLNASIAAQIGQMRTNYRLIAIAGIVSFITGLLTSSLLSVTIG
ncbi:MULTISPECIES: hypothetical protein [Aeromonas]|uniref:Uncharacterized protein n=1 Tax=Aeromonas caviae TaxID=648 RepID=A0AAJ6CT71_AERCA|nr:hypothetical protein [Aeromonas caviae]RWT73689.1 hypothetical protein DN604_16500 [Aeromonas caviae]WFG00235.1 hypothetical protein P5S46_22330 [Aeromonas caviae]WVM47838.1 hypothetical protein V0242_24875 [Aeromonas hydrophila]